MTKDKVINFTLQLHRLMTLSTGIIQRELGRLSHAMQGEVRNRLRKLFSI